MASGSMFLANYDLLKNHSSFEIIKPIFITIKCCNMMQNFALRSPAKEVVIAINKIIQVFQSGKTTELEKEGLDIETAVRSTAIMCLECLYNGLWPMIPKIRSRAAFLGNVAGQKINDKNIRENISRIFNLFEQKRVEFSQRKFDFMKEKAHLDSLLDQALDNTLKVYNNNLPPLLRDAIKKKVLGDKITYNSMLEDIITFKTSPDFEGDNDILANANFIDNPDVMGFILKAIKANELVREATNQNHIAAIDPNKIVNAILIKKPGPKRRVFKFSLGKKKKGRNLQAPPIAAFGNKDITVDIPLLRDAVPVPKTTDPNQMAAFNQAFLNGAKQIIAL